MSKVESLRSSNSVTTRAFAVRSYLNRFRVLFAHLLSGQENILPKTITEIILSITINLSFRDVRATKLNTLKLSRALRIWKFVFRKNIISSEIENYNTPSQPRRHHSINLSTYRRMILIKKYVIKWKTEFDWNFFREETTTKSVCRWLSSSRRNSSYSAREDDIRSMRLRKVIKW